MDCSCRKNEQIKVLKSEWFQKQYCWTMYFSKEVKVQMEEG